MDTTRIGCSNNDLGTCTGCRYDGDCFRQDKLIQIDADRVLEDKKK